MDHVISALKRWLDIYKEDGEDKLAIKCIRNAIKELEKYYYE